MVILNAYAKPLTSIINIVMETQGAATPGHIRLSRDHRKRPVLFILVAMG